MDELSAEDRAAFRERQLERIFEVIAEITEGGPGMRLRRAEVHSVLEQWVRDTVKAPPKDE